MFNRYEALRCVKCKKAFMGRKPAVGGDILCPDCLMIDTLPMINDGDDIPDSVIIEVTREAYQDK